MYAKGGRHWGNRGRLDLQEQTDHTPNEMKSLLANFEGVRPNYRPVKNTC